MVFQVDATAAFRRCQVPMLYVAGARDTVVPRRNLRIVQQINPTIRSAIIDAPHMVLQTHPREAAHAISTFLRGKAGQV
jgi:pimeloyl-ACP methyl ester carboxylesterase